MSVQPSLKAYILVKDFPSQVQIDNIQAATNVGDLLRTCLGPCAMHKMIMTRIGSIELTNDGNSILREIDVSHPAAKSLVELAKTQDNVVGDGTTSVILLATEILKNMKDLVRDNHPIKVTKAMGIALTHCLEGLKDVSVDLKKHEDKLRVIRNSINTKISSILKIKVDELAIKAIQVVSSSNSDIDIKNNVKVVKILGDPKDCEVLDGIMIDKSVYHPQMRRYIENPRIIVLDMPLEFKKNESKTVYQFRDVGSFTNALEDEERQVTNMCAAIIKWKPDVVITEKGISDLAMSIFSSNNVTALRRLKKTDATRIVKACGGKLVSSLEDLNEGSVARGCRLFENLKIGEEYYCKFSKCKAPAACSVILRGESKEILNEIERNFQDAVMVAKNVFQSPKMCPGGGATEMYLSTYLEKVDGNELEKAVFSGISEALQSIPAVLAKSSGHHDPTALLDDMEKKNRSNKFIGIDGVKGEIVDVRRLVMEPVAVKSQMLKSAFEAASLILRVDGVISSSNIK